MEPGTISEATGSIPPVIGEIKPGFSDEYVMHRRFDRMGRLVGDEMMKKLFNSHVMMIGIGGVGSWAAEGIARAEARHESQAR